MSDWHAAGIVFSNDELKIGGLNVWAEEWRPGKADLVLLPHPTYPNQVHDYKIYEIGDSARPVRFAASELSNGVWGFYIPVEN